MAEASAPSPDRPLLGIALRIGSASVFAFMGAMLKLASDHGVSAPEMILYRNLFALPLVLGWVVAGPGLGALATRHPLAHLTRSMIGLISMLFTFEALVLLPLAEATSITFSAPLLSTVLSALLIGERIGRYRWGAVLLGFVGILVITRPGGVSAAVPMTGVAVALCAALGQAAVMVTLRQIARTEHVAAIVFWFTVATTSAGAAMLPFFGRWHDAGTWPLLIACGVAGGCGQIMMTGSLRHAPVATVVPFDYLQMAWAVLFGWLIWSDAPGVATIAGMLLIGGAGLLTVWREHSRHLAPSSPAMNE